MKTRKIFIEPYQDLGFAKVDLHRECRTGFPEVLFCEGKTADQIVEIARRIFRANSRVLMTRVNQIQAKRLKRAFRRGRHFTVARVFFLGKEPAGKGLVAVLSAGTADIPVAEEAAKTAEIMGAKVERIFDVGVAGIHRLLAYRKIIEKARAVVVVAGMDGVLASVVAGLFSRPIIAVPTSIGYGLNLKGISALLTMLNSCAPGVAVVNIDNGFGAGYIAAKINNEPRMQ